MIIKRIKKILKLTILIAARQIWKLLCNLYNLIREPVVVIKSLIKSRDKSQIFLVVMVLLMPIISYFLARIVWDYYRYGVVIKDVGWWFGAAVAVQIGLLLYIGYWVLKAVRK
ncbi:MAG TPA: hypothetical protein PKZ29_00850 [Candidatus Woesebacteria bacterium]|jgi:hypothetical protein|nr:hypothetical protein [Candidatus Woesebacteria bacterium]HOG37452.1 hypothetical protein [Candidatus Woesebacteria bacterium]